MKILIATPQTVIIRSINREEYPDETMTKEEFSDGVEVIGRVFWSSHTW
ncbi:transcriptional regulator [Leminorella grimontii ATCC 33999 = DSM 5078]|nr:transcriptional regulator [Leminorella grimontii ATCC 33999 = DSM 5078]